MEPDSTGQSPSGKFSDRHQSGRSSGSSQKSSIKSRYKPLYFRFWFWLLVGFGGGLAALSSVWLSIESSLPLANELFATVRSQTLTIAAGDGTILQQQGPATREPLKIEQIPKPLVQAFIASEDRRFYQHRGFDRQGIVRAVWANLRSANLVEGGSTITQQLARILFLNQERSLWRKLKEIRLAMKIEENLSKDQILERYLNSVYLGQGAYGVADAAWVYFSKSVNQLTLSEIATIAGLAPAPNFYSPTVNKSTAIGRRNLVLQRMQEDGVITASEATAARESPLTIKTSSPKRLQAKASYFTTYIQRELPKYVPADALKAGGLTVETSLNPKWQQAAEAVVLKTVTENGKWQRFEQAALVAIDPRNGEVRAMVGGTDFGKHQFNRATQAQRQPGSTFKGFVYTAAIASGLSPYKQYLDSPFKVDGYEPKNFSERFRGNMSMRDALAASINVVAVKVLMDVGFDPTIKLAQSMGIKSPLIPAYSLALGSAEVNLLELSSAYGSLATGGMHTEAHGIRRIRDRSGNIIYDAQFKSQRVLDPDSAAIATWMLRNVITAGTGGAAALVDRSVAGKTGTSDKARDLWFVGYIPQLVTGVWLGNDNNQPTAGSSSTAAYAWNRFMVQAVEGMAVEKFAALPNLDNRKPSIKRQPVKPRRISIGKITDQNSEGGSLRQGENSENYQPTRRRRRRDRQSQELRRRLWRSRLQRQTSAADPQRYNRLMDRLRQNRIPRQPTLFPSQEIPTEGE
ncbi:transglycosylase domain-containing protein [Chroococcidiopsis sp.]|uniref:transglycosylase domain-containing protein n=1 Tax=Chroococcidiopsis sp. TaxID=3088168 RepID=UPI003F2C553D